MGKTFSDFGSLFKSLIDFIKYTYKTMHNFLLQYMDNTVLGILEIFVVAVIFLIIFKKVSE